MAEERIGNVRTVRSFAQELKEIQTYDSKIDHVLRLTYKESLAKGIFFGMVRKKFCDIIASLALLLLFVMILFLL